MKKIAKASIATAAGVALLLGGGTTFATWNDSASAGNAATITAGNLVVEAATDGAWTANGGTDAIDIATYRVAPGDVLTYTETMTITAEGNSLQATLALTEESIAAASVENAADVALAAYLVAEADIQVEGDGITADGENFTVAPGTGVIQEDVTVTVDITFPAGDTAGDNNDAKTGAVTLAAFAVSLTQITA